MPVIRLELQPILPGESAPTLLLTPLSAPFIALRVVMTASLGLTVLLLTSFAISPTVSPTDIRSSRLGKLALLLRLTCPTFPRAEERTSASTLRKVIDPSSRSIPAAPRGIPRVWFGGVASAH